MAKPELGEKRICPECGTKYYDLNKDPIVCPKCSAVFVTEAHETDKAKPEKEAEAVASKDDEEDLEDDGPEIISLEDADDDDGDTVDGDDDDVPVDIPDVEIEGADDDDQDGPFLEDDDDDSDNLEDIIPVRGDDDET